MSAERKIDQLHLSALKFLFPPPPGLHVGHLVATDTQTLGLSCTGHLERASTCNIPLQFLNSITFLFFGKQYLIQGKDFVQLLCVCTSGIPLVWPNQRRRPTQMGKGCAGTSSVGVVLLLEISG